MSSLAIQIVIVILLMLVGIGLMVWAYVNPRWQYPYDDDDESIIPSIEEIEAADTFAIGALTLVVGWAWGIVLGVIYMAGGG